MRIMCANVKSFLLLRGNVESLRDYLLVLLAHTFLFGICSPTHMNGG